tara:strand:+ start:9 stop:500 length:492 start_codon:yes stop_codon:yes gene_type:complete
MKKIKPSWLNLGCAKTLKQGLDELYILNPEIKKTSDRAGKLFFDHDLTHIIFGADAKLDHEILLDYYTLFGTEISWKKMKEYFNNPEIKVISKQIFEKKGFLKFFIFYYPSFFLKIIKVIIQAKRMKKKWPFENVSQKMLNSSIIDLREEYGIKRTVNSFFLN